MIERKKNQINFWFFLRCAYGSLTRSSELCSTFIGVNGRVRGISEISFSAFVIDVNVLFHEFAALTWDICIADVLDHSGDAFRIGQV